MLTFPRRHITSGVGMETWAQSLLTQGPLKLGAKEGYGSPGSLVVKFIRDIPGPLECLSWRALKIFIGRFLHDAECY